MYFTSVTEVNANIVKCLGFLIGETELQHPAQGAVNGTNHVQHWTPWGAPRKAPVHSIIITVTPVPVRAAQHPQLSKDCPWGRQWRMCWCPKQLIIKGDADDTPSPQTLLKCCPRHPVSSLCGLKHTLVTFTKHRPAALFPSHRSYCSLSGHRTSRQASVKGKRKKRAERIHRSIEEA